MQQKLTVKSETSTASDTVEHLRKLKFIGTFPRGIDVLLVSVNTAVEEMRLIDKEYKESRLLKELKEQDIHVFPNIEAWVKFKDPDRKRRR